MALNETYTAGDEMPAADVVAIAKALNRVFFAGLEDDFFGIEASVPTGWFLEDGKTIGDGTSGASARANADMAALFAVLWAVGNADGTLSIYTSAGAGSTYGANAAADFAAHKRIALPDGRGYVYAGKDTMGGADAGRIVTNDAQGDKVGGVAGAENHTLLTAEMPTHTHSLSSPVKYFGTSGAGTPNINVSDSDGSDLTIGNAGGGGAHNNMQPTTFRNKIICAGVVW